MTSAIIVAAGSSRRMGFDKLFTKLAGRAVLMHSLHAFEQSAEIDEIIVVAREERMDEIEALIGSEKLLKVSKLVAGGDERHQSVWNGLQAVSADGSEFIAIHDGARPLITPQIIGECLEAARQHGGACCASPIPDRVKRVGPDQMVNESVERTGLWAMQTPQVFSSGLILQAYAHVMGRNELVTDEVSAVQKLGKRVFLIRNTDWNFKITFPSDIDLAHQVLLLREKKKELTQAGSG